MKFVSEVASIKEQIRLKQLATDNEYSGTIDEFLGTTSRYDDKFIMQEGELVYVSEKVLPQEAKWCEQLGI